MFELRLNGIQRLGIEVVLSRYTGTVDELRPVMALLEKIRLPVDIKASATLPGGGIDLGFLRTIEEQTFELSAEHVVLLERLLSSYKAFSVSDLEWVEPVLEQLRSKKS